MSLLPIPVVVVNAVVVNGQLPPLRPPPPHPSAGLTHRPTGICALHNYLFSSMAVLCHQCVCLLFPPPAERRPTSLLGSTHAALNALPLSRRAPLCPTSLPLLSPAGLSFFSSSPLSCSQTRAAHGPPLQPSLLWLLLCMSTPRLTFFPRWPLLSARSLVSLLHISLHEDFAPAEVDELPEPQRPGEERERFPRGPRREAEEGRSQRHLEHVRRMQ